MSNRPILSGIPTVEVDQTRYDELLHKEALLQTIEHLYGRMSEYLFRDAIGHLLKTEIGKADAQD
jgi:hypothetical protein